MLLDLDGVLYVEDEPIEGARGAPSRALREAGLPLRFVTNTTARSAAPRPCDKLKRLGFVVERRRAGHAGGAGRRATAASAAIGVWRSS